MLIPGLRLGAAIGGAAVAFLLLLPGAAPAATKGADLRVVNSAGRVLAEQRQYTGTVKIKTDPRADCFGAPGGSGDRVRVRGATALGLVRDALGSDRDLRPLSVTDQFSFGLAVCGIGGYEAHGSSFWYLKHEHAGAQVGGDQLRLSDGDEVLWYLAPGFPPPPELVLRAPARAQPGVPFEVTVFEYEDDGSRSPASGARVTGGDNASTTGAGGVASVTVSDPGTAKLRATRSADGAIPSNGVKVCVDADPSMCPEAHGKRIYGSVRGDEIDGTRGWDRIRARRGRDRVDLRRGGIDRVRCGGGRDVVVRARGDRDDEIAASCERVIRK
jgi:hypothetical protein